MQVKISDKFQVVIPKEARERLHIKSGQMMQVKSVAGTTITFDTRSELELYIEKAKNMKPTKKPFDPIEAREELRHEWNDNEQTRLP